MIRSEAVKVKISENLLVQVWKGQRLVKERLFTAEGRRVQVLYPGRLNPDCGPDFLGALLAFDEGELMEGDVELHVRSSDWRAHRHHLDSRYNGVALHVVMWDGGVPAVSQGGKRVPTLALHPCLDAPLEEIRDWVRLPPSFPDPCFHGGKRLGSEAVARLLESLGEERFRSKGAFFEAELSGQNRDQVLYVGIMEALGYTKNKRPFGELGRRLPLRILEGYAQGKRGARKEALLQALLFGTAGLLPSQRGREPRGESDAWAQELERLWGSLGTGDAMREEDWAFFRVRPENLPPRRIAGAAYLLSRYMEAGLFESLLKLLEEVPFAADSKALQDSLAVIGEGYWADHFDFGRGGWRSPALIGGGRAGEVAVNVLLPFFYAWSQLASKQELGRRTLELYRAYPPQGPNRITRQMTERLLGKEGSGVVNSAQRQQGLIHLYQTFCWKRRCADCPASSKF